MQSTEHPPPLLAMIKSGHNQCWIIMSLALSQPVIAQESHYCLQPREETKFNVISNQHGRRNNSLCQMPPICPVFDYSYVRMQKYLSVMCRRVDH